MDSYPWVTRLLGYKSGAPRRSCGPLILMKSPPSLLASQTHLVIYIYHVIKENDAFLHPPPTSSQTATVVPLTPT